MPTALLLSLLLTAKPATEDRDVAQARKMFQWGQRLYKQARYADAIVKFEEAYRLKPHTVIYFNLGRCYEQLGEIPKALRYYKDYLRTTPDAQDRETVSDAIANLERRLKEQGLQQLMVFADPAEARISVDGQELGTSPASVELKPGNHRLVVQHEGYVTVNRSFVMPSQRSMEMTINLRQVSEPAGPPQVRETKPTEPVVTPSSVTATAPAPATASRSRTWVYVAAGVAGVGLAGGVGMGLAANGASTELRRTIHSGPEAQALASQASSMAMGANISYGVAAAAGVTAVILYLMEGKPAVTPGAAQSGVGAFTF